MKTFYVEGNDLGLSIIESDGKMAIRRWGPNNEYYIKLTHDDSGAGFGQFVIKTKNYKGESTKRVDADTVYELIDLLLCINAAGGNHLDGTRIYEKKSVAEY